jgi:hypothetical protein
MAIELTPLHPTLAAELRGVDLTRQGLAGLRVGAFWEPGDPALISLPYHCRGQPGWRILNRPLVDRQKQVTAPMV